MSTVPDAERTQPFPDFTPRTRPAEQAQRLGGIRWGSAFFGWVTAMAMTALLGALAVAAGTATGLVDPAAPAGAVGVGAALVLLAIVFAAYYCGGYVAGRMARFAGARQGVAVWLWTLLLAVIGTLAGGVVTTVATGTVPVPSLYDLVQDPMSGGVLSAGAAAFAVGLLVLTLVGAVLGGLAGMRYHRRVDRELAAVVPEG